MRRFFERTFTPFFLITGFGTATIGLYAVLPEWAVTTLGKLSFLQDYTIIVQHWGIMVGLMGVCMMIAAVYPGWRNPILIYSALEKAFMAYLVLTNASHAYAEGFWIAAAGDSTIVLYTVGYFAVCGFGPAPALANGGPPSTDL